MTDSSRQTTKPPAKETTPREHCAFCEAPLPADSGVAWHGAAKYCCYGCRILGEGAARPIAMSTASSSPWFKIAVGAVLAGQAMLLGMAINLAPPTGLARWLLHGALIGASVGVLAILGGPLWATAIEEIRQRRVTVELLFLAGVAGALGASLHSTFTGTGAVYYEVVGVLTTVYAIGKTLGAQSRARALAETRQLHRNFETCQQLAPDGSVRSVRVTEIQPGDEVLVLAGEPIPIDGRIVAGQAFVCETPLTGEPFPVVRRAGDAVWAGSYSEDGELRLAATAPGTGRRLDMLLAALEAARERPCRIQAQADRMVRWFLPLVLAISVGTFGFWTWKSGWAAGLYNALAVLLVACPCAMGLATPVALWSGLAALAARGLVLRGGDEIERLATVRQMVFDKTGTLSEERFTLIDLATLGSVAERRELTGQLRAVQNACAHPVARAFHAFAKGDEAGFTVRRLKTIAGLGIEAWIESARGEEHHLRAGGRELVVDRTPESELLSRLRHSASDHLVYVEVDGRLGAIAAVNERLRDSARESMRALERQGMTCLVLTGDSPERATRLLGSRAIEGGLSPNEKAARIEDLKRSGMDVGFVGDGVNDAPAMRAASIGIALAHGAGVTTAGADAVLYGGDLRVLPWAVALSRQVRDSIRSNLLFAGAYNVIGIVLAATGLLHPVVSALLMVVSSFTVSWRALRATECGYACGAGASGAEAAGTSPAPPDANPPARAIVSRGWGWDRLALRPSPEAIGVRSRRTRLISSLLLAAQIPFLIYLGQLTGRGAILTATTMLAIAVFMLRFHTNHAEGRHLADMVTAMLGFGNWGMILGWWADGGFNPVHACCLGTLGGGFSFLSFTHMPWMNAGMLLFGLPPMLLGPDKAYRGLGRKAYGILSSIGMIWGMSFGSFVSMKWLGPWGADKFLLSLSGMTVGMLLGMVLACELGRAISLAFRARSKGAEAQP